MEESLIDIHMHDSNPFGVRKENSCLRTEWLTAGSVIPQMPAVSTGQKTFSDVHK